MTSIMFETFNVGAFYVHSTGPLSLFSTGRTTGLSVEMGDGVSHVVPVVDGISNPSAIRRLNMGGRDITEYLVKILCEKGYEMTTSAERQIVCDIKEKLCFTSLNYKYELDCFNEYEKTVGPHEPFVEKPKKKYGYEVLNYFDYYEPLFKIFPVELIFLFHHYPICVEYELPDGSKMTIDSERFRAPEIMFQPSFIGSEIPGIDVTCFNVLKLFEDEYKSDLLNVFLRNIVIGGGTAMFDGFNHRLRNGIKGMVDKEYYGTKKKEIKVWGGKNGNLQAWMGASVMSSMDSFSKFWITKDAYDDAGATIVHRKCVP